MTELEAIREFEYLKRNMAESKTAWSRFAIDSFDEAIKALNKQIPVKPYKLEKQCRCSVCKKNLAIMRNKRNYCDRCGQAIDWSGFE